MKFHIFAVYVFVFIIGTITVDYALGQIDPLTEIDFLQSGLIYSDENEFNISNDINIREFFDGKIIRVSGQTIEGFPYITYSKISNENIDTHGIIFINNQFVKLSFKEKPIIIENKVEKNNDLLILVQYTQQIFSKNFANISMYIFDKEENNSNNFYQKDGRLPNTDIEILILDGDNKKFYSTNGTTDNFGFFETEFWIPDNYKKDTFTIAINAENNDSKSSKILQMYTLGNYKSSGNSTAP